jgi:hypothetical protein
VRGFGLLAASLKLAGREPYRTSRVVARLLRGEPLELVARETNVSIAG